MSTSGGLLDGERKSVEPLSHRIRLPEGRSSTNPKQAIQQFVSPSQWDHGTVLERYRGHLSHTSASPDGIVPFDDMRPVARGAIAERVCLQRVSLRDGTKGMLSGRVA
ncbi:transposase [Gemmata sp. JC717]|uniref:transposase n=1 Tax=Gemmata algarum TaxID=2975278 RepID=UPI0021BA82A2|nr:transposase [Gemmata algarum]MDY3555126.1 transposase [Gemmata algarum]